MARTRLFLAVALLLVAVSVVLLLRDRDEEGRAAAHGARVSGHVAVRSREVLPQVVEHAAPLADDAARLAQLPAAERAMLSAGLRSEEVFALKAGFPDWETRFANASPDMVKASTKRVEHLVPTIIPDEAAPALGLGDEAAHAFPGAGGTLDDVAGGAARGGGVLDDVARAGGRFGDDILRLIGLGAAGAGAAGAAALRKRKRD